MSTNNRENALLNAYLSSYKNQQAKSVTSGRQAVQTARQQGTAILNATDKTLPSLGNPYESTLQNIVSGASTENQLNRDLLDRQTKLAKAQFDYVSDYNKQLQKAQAYAQKAAKKAAASSPNADSLAAMQQAADALNRQRSQPSATGQSSKPNTDQDAKVKSRTAAERNASARAKYDGSEQEKADQQYFAQQKAAAEQQKKAATLQQLKEKQRTSKAKNIPPAGQTNRSAQNKAVVKPQAVRAGSLPDNSYNAQSRGISPSASGYAAAAQAPTEKERSAARQRKQQTADALQRLQTDPSYILELAQPGRKLTTAEIDAVNQYDQNAGDLYKQYQAGALSLDDYDQQAQALSRLNQKASMNGAGQDWQAFAAGLAQSTPFLQQTQDAITSLTPNKENAVSTLDTLQGYSGQNPLASSLGTMAGKTAQYKMFNSLVEGTKYADAANAAGGKIADAAKRIPGLGTFIGDGFGAAAGRVLADTGADLALDTLPTLANEWGTYNKQQEALANGEAVENPLTPLGITGDIAKNIAGNVAMNALPEIGSAVVNGVKNSFSGAMLDESLQETAAAAGKNSSLDTRSDLPRADTPAAVDLEKNADAFLRDVNSADAVKSVPDSTATNFTSTPQNAAQGLADAAADAPGGAIRERGFAESLRTNSDLPDAVKRDFVTAPEVYNQLSNAETKARADAVLAKGQGEAVTAYQKMLSQRDPAAVPLGYELAKQYIAGGDSDSAVELLRGMSKELTASGQFSQAAAISLMQNDPMTALRYAQRSIDDLNAAGAKELGRQWKNFRLTDAEIQAFQNIPAGDSSAIADAMEGLGKRLAKEYPVSTTQKVAELRRLGFLLNPRTQIRNIASNVAQMPVTGISDKVSAALQSLYAKTGKSTDFVQTKALHIDKNSRDIAEQVWSQVKDTIDGSSSYEQPLSDVVQNAEIFKLGEGQQHNILANVPGVKQSAQILESISQKFTGKNVFDQMSSEKSVLENIRQFTYGLLELGDAPFVKKAFTDSLANIAAANKITSADKITADMIAQATQDAMKTTYKDSNAWTELFSSVHKLGVVGEMIMPFTQTPANMVARSLDYSPVGLVKGVKDFYTKGGNPAEYIDEIAKGLTGTAGIALGASLYKADILTGAESDNANKKAFDKQNGFLPFAIHVPDTNLYYRISDFQPSMMPVITGAAWAQTASGDATAEQAAKGAVTAFVNTLADNTNLSNLGDLFGSYDGLGGGLWDAALGLPQSMVPSLSNAVAKSTDTTVRNPYDATNPIQSQKNQIMAKIPGLSQQLPAAYDTWGNEKQRDNAAFEQFLDPAAFTNQEISARNSEIQRLYDSTGDVGVFPPSIKNGTEVAGLKLNNTQTSEYQRVAGQTNSQVVNILMQSDEYKSADDAYKAEMLKSAYNIGREAGKEAVNSTYTSTDKDYLAYKQYGLQGAVLASSVGAVLDAARDEKRNSTGDQNASLNKHETWQAIPSLESPETRALAYLLNTSDKTAQEIYDAAGGEATAAYLDIYTAAKADDSKAGKLEYLQEAVPVLQRYALSADQQMQALTPFLSDTDPALRIQQKYGSSLTLQYLQTYAGADTDRNGNVSDTEFKNALLQTPGLSQEDAGRIYLAAKTTDTSTDEKAQAFNATFGPAGVYDYLYLSYLERAYHTAEANRKIAAGEGGNPDGSYTRTDLIAALNYMDLTNAERRIYFSLVAPTWKNPY